MTNKITVTSAGTIVNANVTPDSAMYYSNKSKEWAISDRIVDNTDYSSKYYANESKKQADISTAKATEVVESGNTAVSNIESARDNAITNVNTAGATQVALATEQATIATNKASEVVASGNEALSNISTAKDNAIISIANQETTSKNNVIATGNEQVAIIEATGNNYDNLTHKNITNCLLEVPQRIKLELNNGTLTLKAGSQVIVPNGFEADGTTPKFDYVTIGSDVGSGLKGNGVTYPIYNPATTTFRSHLGQWESGATRPSGTYIMWYDTASNIVRYTNDGWVTETTGLSLPTSKCTCTSSGYTSIDQVFNGFGYIGSTVWVDKGVKGLIPNGRNEDGSLNNIEFTTQNILLRNNTEKGSYYLVIVDGGTRVSIANKQNWVFDEKSNSILENGVIRDNIGFYGDITLDTGGVITSFNPKQPFRAVDYNDVSNTPHIIDTYVNGTSGYRIWSDGYCEQWGRANYPQVPANGSKSTTITFLKKFANVNYCVSHNIITDGGNTTGLRNHWINLQVETLKFGWYSTNSTNAGGTFGWRACGYLASGQY